MVLLVKIIFGTQGVYNRVWVQCIGKYKMMWRNCGIIFYQISVVSTSLRYHESSSLDLILSLKTRFIKGCFGLVEPQFPRPRPKQSYPWKVKKNYPMFRVSSCCHWYVGKNPMFIHSSYYKKGKLYKNWNKISKHYSHVTYLKWTPARYVLKREKTTCSKKIGLHVQNVLTILDSIVNIIMCACEGGPSYGSKVVSFESYTWISERPTFHYNEINFSTHVCEHPKFRFHKLDFYES